jgi:glycosyltransferase involved in cell wall biosynthesis
MAILSVVIPTYNRNELLNYSLGRLLDANIDKFDVTVSVFDNKSAVPVESSIPAEIRREFGNRLKIVSNKANIGLCANILKGIEAAEGDWIWVLSDDDPAVTSCFDSIITRAAEAETNTAAVNFAPPGIDRECAQTTSGIAEFLNMANPLWPYTIISSSIYRREEITRFMDPGYRAIFSMYPHFALLLLCLDKGSRVMHVPERIIDFTENASFSWSKLELQLGVTTLAELPLKWVNKKLLYEQLRTTTPGPRAFISLIEKECPEFAEQIVLLNQFVQRRFADRPFKAAAASIGSLLYLMLRALR